MEEFQDLTVLISRMEKCGAHRAGIAKIRVPEEWVARRQGYRPSEIDLEIQAPVQQTLAPTNIEGAFQATHKPFPKLRVEEFRYMVFFFFLLRDRSGRKTINDLKSRRYLKAEFRICIRFMLIRL
jgi:hypothetical protein